MSEGKGGNPPRFDGDEGTLGFQTILRVAEALREEFGVGIDAHPGGEGSEAGVVNRAFRAAVGVILGAIISAEDGPAAILTWVLRQAAFRRLAELGVDEELAEGLLSSGPGHRDRWLAYLALAPAVVLGDLMTGDRG